MAFSNCTQCGKPSPKPICDNCIAIQLSELPLAAKKDSAQASRAAATLMTSQAFLANEGFFWPRVAGQKFLEDCYYKCKLGESFNKYAVSVLPTHAHNHIPDWYAKDKSHKCASLAKSFYDEIIEEQRRAHEALARADEEKKSREQAEIKRRAAMDEKLRLEREKLKAMQLADLKMKSRHYLNFVTFPPFLLGMLLGILSPFLGFLGILLIICLPFLYRYMVSNIYFDTILKVSNLVPSKISSSKAYNIFADSKILSAHSMDWAQSSSQNTALIVYLYLVAGTGMVLGSTIVSMIMNYFQSIVKIFQ
jgi:hypothetical protein